MITKTTRRQKALIFLESTKLSFYNQVTGQLLTLPFPQEVVKSSDIVDKPAFLATMQAFITTNKVPPSSIVLVISENLLFTKDIVHSEPVTPIQPLPVATSMPVVSTGIVPVVIPQERNTPQVSSVKPTISPQPQPQSEQSTLSNPVQQAVFPLKKVISPAVIELQQKEENENAKIFIEKVPYENILYRTVKIQNGIRVLATNGELVESLQQAFFQSYCIIEAAIAVTVFGFPAGTPLSVDVAKQILQKPDVIKQNNFFEAARIPGVSEEDDKESALKKVMKNGRLYIMLGIFGALVIMLIVVFAFTREETPAKNKKTTLTPSPSVAAVVPTTPIASEAAIVSDTVSSGSASFSQSTSVHIRRTAANSVNARNLIRDLQALGIRNITEEDINASQSGVIFFASDIPQNARNIIFTQVKKYIPTVITQDGNTEAFDIIVLF